MKSHLVAKPADIPASPDGGSKTVQPNGKLEFGGLTLDPERGMLFRGGDIVPLRRQSVDLLMHLARHPGRPIARAALVRAVWASPPADPDASLAQCIKDIRAALGPDARQLVRTVPRIGYQFSGEVRQIPVPLSGEAESPLPNRERRPFISRSVLTEWVRHPAVWISSAVAIGLAVAIVITFRSPPVPVASDTNALRESFRYLGPGKIGTGEKVTLKTDDGRTIHCEGGDLNIKTPRKCLWGDKSAAAR